MRVKLESYGKGTEGHVLELGPITIYFSYATPIAVYGSGKRFIRENDWGPTTGRHLNHIDEGGKEAKAARLPSTEFERRLGELLERLED